MRNVLVLFDIDGTLLIGHGAGRRAMDRAFREIFGVSNAFDGVAMHGSTDPLIVRAGFRKHGVETEERTFVDRYLIHLEDELRLRPAIPARGVPELLSALAREPSVNMGLVTGNVRRG